VVTTSSTVDLAGERRCRTSPSHDEDVHDAKKKPNSAGRFLLHQAIARYRQALFVLFFLAAFMFLDGSSTASQQWQGAPPWYLPVGLSVALFLNVGRRASLLVFLCSLIAAGVNFHRPLFSWAGIPGAIGVYLGYMAAAELLKKWWQADLERGRLRDVGRYLVAFFGGSVVSTGIGALTLLSDGVIHKSELMNAVTEWWFSDALAIVAFAPFLILYVCPLVRRLLSPDNNAPFGGIQRGHFSAAEKFEVAAQCALGMFAIWLVFAYKPAIPYQPLYLLFIPVIWVAVRRGFHGTVLATFAIVAGMMVAAWVTRSHQGSLPRLQLAMVVLSVTGCFLGAVVTERRYGEQSLRESEKRYRHLFEQNLAGVFRATLSGEILECNPVAAMLFGYDSPEEALNFDLKHLFGDDLEPFLARLTGSELDANREIMLRRKAGDAVWAMLSLRLVEHESGKGGVLQGTLVNITERKLAEDRVQSLAYFDSLTALPNRTLLRDRLSQALAAARRSGEMVGVLFLDLDHFKMINDSLGHSIGDDLLKEVSERLKASVRDEDTVARLGGDEFVIVLSKVKDIKSIFVVADKFIDKMTGEFIVQGHTLRIGCSMGISIFPDDGADAETLIRHADSAMYSAKGIGRNNYQFFTASMSEQALERLSLENALRLAIDNRELFLMYQPQVDVVSGNVIGLEALLRWQHPKLGLVPPDRFIPVAETSGLILPIGDWVLKTACTQAKRWQECGLSPLPIAVNVSAVQFHHAGFCNGIKAVLDESALAPEALELELTESVLLTNADKTVTALQELKAMGIKLAIDDFGMGYSSLSYLKRFPVSTLKIDRSFIRDVAIDPDDAAITTAIINMAKALNVRVIAEGVENEAQMSFLRAHQCDGIQGYYFSRPLTAEDATTWISGRARGIDASHDIICQNSLQTSNS